MAGYPLRAESVDASSHATHSRDMQNSPESASSGSVHPWTVGSFTRRVPLHTSVSSSHTIGPPSSSELDHESESVASPPASDRFTKGVAVSLRISGAEFACELTDGVSVCSAGGWAHGWAPCPPEGRGPTWGTATCRDCICIGRRNHTFHHAAHCDTGIYS